jgi:hypothetical protein
MQNIFLVVIGILIGSFLTIFSYLFYHGVELIAKGKSNNNKNDRIIYKNIEFLDK